MKGMKRCMRICAIRVFRRSGGKKSFFHRFRFLPALIILCFASIKLLSTPVLASDENTEEWNAKLTNILRSYPKEELSYSEDYEKVLKDAEEQMLWIKMSYDEIRRSCKEYLDLCKENPPTLELPSELDITKISFDARLDLTKLRVSCEKDYEKSLYDVETKLASLELSFQEDNMKLHNDVKQIVMAFRCSYEVAIKKLRLAYEVDIMKVRSSYETKMITSLIDGREEVATFERSFKEEVANIFNDAKKEVANLEHSLIQEVTKILADGKRNANRIKLSYDAKVANGLLVNRWEATDIESSFKRKANELLGETKQEVAMWHVLADVIPKSTAKNAHSYFLVSAVVVTLSLIVAVSLVWLLSRRQSCLSRHAEPKLGALAELP